MFRSDPNIVWRKNKNNSNNAKKKKEEEKEKEEKKKEEEKKEEKKEKKKKKKKKKKKEKEKKKLFLKWNMQINVRTSGYNSVFSRLTLLQEQYAVHAGASRFPSVHLTLSTKPTHRFMFAHYLAESCAVTLRIRVWYVNSDEIFCVGSFHMWKFTNKWRCFMQ